MTADQRNEAVAAFSASILTSSTRSGYGEGRGGYFTLVYNIFYDVYSLSISII